MDPLRFVHLESVDAWLRGDHDRTTVDALAATLRLASAAPEEESGAPRGYETWRDARRGVVRVPTPAGLVDPLVVAATEDREGSPFVPREGGVLAGKESGGLVTPGEGGWTPIASAPTRPPDSLRFGPLAPLATPAKILSLTLDPSGREVWGLGGDVDRTIYRWSSADLRALETVAPPPGVRLAHLAAGAGGAIAADERSLFWRSSSGQWRRVALADPFGRELPIDLLELYEPIGVAARPDDDRLVALLLRRQSAATTAPQAGPTIAWAVTEVGSWWGGLGAKKVDPLDAPPPAVVVIAARGRARIFALDLPAPLGLLALQNGAILIGGAPSEDAPPARKARFVRYVANEGGLHAVDVWFARGFDGRGLVADASGRPWATTKLGLRPLFLGADTLERDGCFETLALDSRAYGTQWHRVFIDACCPPQTSIEVWARAADEPLPPGERAPRPPRGFEPSDVEAALTAFGDKSDDPPWGARSIEDVDGWVRLSALDARPRWPDVALAPTRERPLDDPYVRRKTPRDELAFDTLEGLLRVPTGRFLWLRLVLRGTGARGPTIVAVRATCPRPSLLNFLPSFWRADPETARAQDELLSLFEGPLTELDQLVSVLPLLFDPRVCPPEMLDWLARFGALALDRRLSTPARRQLVSEIFALYRARGTVPGLERLIHIICGCRVRVVEHFRLRPRPFAVGTSPVGAGLRLADMHRPDEPWEAELAQRFQLRKDRRDAQAKAWADALKKPRPSKPARGPCCGVHPEPKPPCPEIEPEPPLVDDPLARFYRGYAYRFTVMLAACRTDALAALVDETVEAWKPAHTLHELCWLGAGFRLGDRSYLGVVTHLGPADPTSRAVLGHRSATLGRGARLSTASTARGLRLAVRAHGR